MPFGSIPSEFVSDTQSCDYKVPLAEALARVNRLGAIIVTKDGKYYGIVDDRAVTSIGGLKLDSNFPVGKVARQVALLNEGSDIKKAISLFYSSATKVLPFTQDGKITGIVRRTSILKTVLSMHIMSDLKVNDIMSTPLLAVDSETSIERARASMRENRVNRLVVLERGRLLGILTPKTLMKYGLTMRKKLPQMATIKRHVKAGDICERNIHTIDYGTGVDSAIRAFVEKDISSLPVIRNGKPVGIITVRDIFETIVKTANVDKRNIVISGLDPELKEYEEEILAELETFADKVERFSGAKVDYIALNVKRIKSKEYELRSRMAFTRGGAVSMYVSGYTLEATLKELVSKMLREARSKNDIVLTGRKL